MDLGRPCSIANIVRFTMTCVWAEAQMDLGRPCSIANIVRFTMTCVWAAAQMDLGRPWRPAAASMIRFQFALGVILASWFPIQVELMDTPGRDKCAANHRTTPRIPTWGTRPPDSDRLITNLEFFPLPSRGDLGARAGLKFWRGLPQGVSLEPLSIIKSRVSAGPNRSR